MKYLILAAVLFGITFSYSNSYASVPPDTQTTGNMKLLQPATGQIDTERHLVDKLNANFEIIDSSFTTNETALSALATDTTTLESTLAGRTLIFNDEGVSAGGNVTSIDCTGAGIGCTQSGSSITLNITATGGGGAATVAGSTQTMTLKVSSVYFSTNSACGIPNACYSVGPSTIQIVGLWADAVKGSTVGWTRIDVLISTGGVGGLPLAPSRFLPLSLSTASSLGASAYTGFVSSGVPIRAGETFGIGISSFAVSGKVTQGLQVHFDYYELGRY